MKDKFNKEVDVNGLTSKRRKPLSKRLSERLFPQRSETRPNPRCDKDLSIDQDWVRKIRKKYYTKTQLTRRWSKRLVDKYYPQCSRTLPNPCYINSSPMKLYNKDSVCEIERKAAFRREWVKAKHRSFRMKYSLLGKYMEEIRSS